MTDNTKKTFQDVQFVHGTTSERTVYSHAERPIITYNPSEWTLDVTLTRKFVPGFYQAFVRSDGTPSGFLSIRRCEKAADIPGNGQYEWRRVNVTEVTD